MKKLIIVILIINFIEINGMNSDAQVRANAAFFQQLVHNLHSPTYLELAMKQYGVPHEKIPQKMQKFYQNLNSNDGRACKKRKTEASK